MATRTVSLYLEQLKDIVLDIIASAENKTHGDGMKDGKILLSMVGEKLKEKKIQLESDVELTNVLNFLIQQGQIRVDGFCYDDELKQQTVWVEVVKKRFG